jgi:hypothetical protein
MNKYKRKCKGVELDVYDVLKAFEVHCPARQHAIKKILCTGIRGHKDELKDLNESIESLNRAVELLGDFQNPVNGGECPYPFHSGNEAEGFDYGEKVSCEKRQGESCKLGYIVGFSADGDILVASEEFNDGHSGVIQSVERTFKDTSAEGKLWYFPPDKVTKL